MQSAITLNDTVFIFGGVYDIMADAAYLGSLLEEAVKKQVCGKEIAVAFSGGLDSGLISVFAKRYSSGIKAYTVGQEDSYDVRAARPVARDIGMDWTHIPITEDDLLLGLKETIRITGTRDPVVLSFEIPLFFVLMNCREVHVIGGQGADELFGGYSKYIGLDKNGFVSLREEDRSKLEKITLPHEAKISEHFGKKMIYPFLDEDLVNAMDAVDITEIMPTADPSSRKSLLKDIAVHNGHPEMSSMEKKAAQYGSGAMAMIRKICKKRDLSLTELIDDLRSE